MKNAVPKDRPILLSDVELYPAWEDFRLRNLAIEAAGPLGVGAPMLAILAVMVHPPHHSRISLFLDMVRQQTHRPFLVGDAARQGIIFGRFQANFQDFDHSETCLQELEALLQDPDAYSAACRESHFACDPLG